MEEEMEAAEANFAAAGEGFKEIVTEVQALKELLK
jgi:hypothetical protein